LFGYIIHAVSIAPGSEFWRGAKRKLKIAKIYYREHFYYKNPFCGGGEIRRYCGGYFSAKFLAIILQRKIFRTSLTNEAVHLFASLNKNSPTMLYIFMLAVYVGQGSKLF
jgi:hypothetical protein